MLRTICLAVALSIAALTLAGCTASTGASTGSTASAGVPATPVVVPAQSATQKAAAAFEASCKYLPTAETAWSFGSAFIKVSDKTRATVQAAFLVAEQTCAAPPTNVISAASVLANALATIRTARQSVTPT